jgi:hypothetical protein
VYVIHHKIPYTLGIVFLLLEYTVLEVLKALLVQVKRLKLSIRSLCLDKGFRCQSVFSFLMDEPYETLIACPIGGKKGGSHSLCKGRESYLTDYTFNAGKTAAYTVRLAVVRTYEKHHSKRHAVWLLYVLIHVSTKNLQTTRTRYRTRFGIEASYRCMRQTHAMTTSRNPALRFFLLGVAFLITNLWIALRWRYCQRPRRGGRTIDKKTYQLQKHRQFIAQSIDDQYYPISAIYAQDTPLEP